MLIQKACIHHKTCLVKY